MKKVGRIIVFVVTLGVLAAAIYTVVWFVGQPGSGGGGISLTLCGLSGGGAEPDNLLIGAYLESKAEELQKPAGSDDTPVVFVVEPGETAADIAARLEREGLISDAELFRRYMQYHGLDAGIEAGEFTLRQTMTVPEIAQALQSGRRPEQELTIQEGLRLEQVADAVAAQTNIPRGEFLALVTTEWRSLGLGYSFLADLPPDATLEGFLFPDTYRLDQEATAVDLLNLLLSTFDARVTPEVRAAAASRGMSIYDLVTMAAIVEREAVLDTERPLIAGVYQNRLDSGWLLNADPTVQYALASQLGTGEWWPALTPEHYQSVDSPYNTYLHVGLPPGPICSPGLLSIQAAAQPADTVYFYFLADCRASDGSHLFAATEEEHFANYAMCGGEVTP